MTDFRVRICSSFFRKRSVKTNGLQQARSSGSWVLWKKSDGDLNWEKSTTFWKGVIEKTKPKVIRGFSAGFDAIASGEVAIFLLSSTNSGLNFMKKGAPIDFASVGRTVASPWGIGMPKTLPHPNAARLFIDYLLSEEGLLDYANAVNGMVIDPVVAKKAYGNVAMKKAGVEWYPVDDETRSDADIRKATRWWARFELAVHEVDAGFQDRWIKPLSHPSGNIFKDLRACSFAR